MEEDDGENESSERFAHTLAPLVMLRDATGRANGLGNQGLCTAHISSLVGFIVHMTRRGASSYLPYGAIK